ncbi:MAG: hypothetical protein NVSMB32_04800 [Actinomycetota bacterium]
MAGATPAQVTAGTDSFARIIGTGSYIAAHDIVGPAALGTSPRIGGINGGRGTAGLKAAVATPAARSLPPARALAGAREAVPPDRLVHARQEP